MKITVVGIGYVGIANAVMLAKNNEVVLLDVVQEKVDMINKLESPIDDSMVHEYLANVKLDISATIDKTAAYTAADYIIIAVPTDYNTETRYFDTSLIENVLNDILQYNPIATIVIKSTIPVGYIDSIKKKFNIDNIMFSPEFLREGTALEDCLHPDRIIIGATTDTAKEFAKLLVEAAEKTDIKVLFMGSTEAEAVKLFANTYLAMRVSYFNELDSYAEAMGLNTKDIINGACLDHRIGTHYNNPSFGYSGYCFKKDVQQLASDMKDIPNQIISSIHKSNELRKVVIANNIIATNPKSVGIYRLIMKSNSDNFRNSAIFDIIEILKANNINILIYEPAYNGVEYNGIQIVPDLAIFKASVDIIIANRVDDNLSDVSDKIYTRDIYHSDL